MKKYDPIKIEEKWQKIWDETQEFKAKTSKEAKKDGENVQKMFLAEMFPYPSGAGLHVGHVRNFSIVDAMTRFYTQQRLNVLRPFGYDTFGLPAENYAIEDQTVLANEQVENGKCWRCGPEVEKKKMKQWFFKITEYADELLDEIDALDWPEKIKVMQKNWIGRSEGAEISFKVDNDDNQFIKVFTTRPDTLFGATFLVLAPEHPMIAKIMTENAKEKVLIIAKRQLRNPKLNAKKTRKKLASSPVLTQSTQQLASRYQSG